MPSCFGQWPASNRCWKSLNWKRERWGRHLSCDAARRTLPQWPPPPVERCSQHKLCLPAGRASGRKKPVGGLHHQDWWCKDVPKHRDQLISTPHFLMESGHRRLSENTKYIPWPTPLTMMAINIHTLLKVHSNPPSWMFPFVKHPNPSSGRPYFVPKGTL